MPKRRLRLEFASDPRRIAPTRWMPRVRPSKGFTTILDVQARDAASVRFETTSTRWHSIRVKLTRLNDLVAYDIVVTIKATELVDKYSRNKISIILMNVSTLVFSLIIPNFTLNTFDGCLPIFCNSYRSFRRIWTGL